MEEQIEINFRLDGDGRTIPTTDVQQSENPEPPTSIDQYESHSIMMELSTVNGNADEVVAILDQKHPLVDELLFDCEISDSGLMPRTFWVPSEGFEPRCSLERMALDVFRHHTKKGTYDPNCSGAEFWVQIRPSPEAGRYTMHAQEDENDNDNNKSKDMAKEGISFHWDKDEDLRILCGGNTYIHPHLSTVTYLTDIGAPTMALNIRVNQMTGEYIVPGETATRGDDNNNNNNDNNNTGNDDKVQGFLSWPKFLKHLCFDGRYLHAAPSDIMEEGAFQKQCQLPPEQGTDQDDTKAKTADQKKLQRRHRRVTFLVNIWLNYKPFDVKPFPDTMISKLSGYNAGESKVSLGLPKESSTKITKASSVEADCIKVGSQNAEENKTERFQWPMGDCSSQEFIEADMPLAFARKQASRGGSIHVTWQNRNGVKMNRVSNTSNVTDGSKELSETLKRDTPGKTSDLEKDSKIPRKD